MNFNYLSPYIRLAWDNQVSPPWYVRERVIFDYELLYIKSGEVHVNIEGEFHHGIAGDIFIFKPKQTHSISIIGKEIYRQPHLHFDFFYDTSSPDVKVSFKPLQSMSEDEMKLFRKDITDQFFSPFPNHIRLQNTVVFEKMIFDIIHEFNSRTPFYEITMKGLFIQLWSYLLREVYWSNNVQTLSNMELLNKIKSYLDYNLSQVITLDDLSKLVHLNKYYISHLFKKTFGVTPIQYHLISRINRAKEMIQFSTFPMSEIAEKLAFQSIHSFSRAFKRMEKVSPSFYRRY